MGLPFGDRRITATMAAVAVGGGPEPKLKLLVASEPLHLRLLRGPALRRTMNRTWGSTWRDGCTSGCWGRWRLGAMASRFV